MIDPGLFKTDDTFAAVIKNLQLRGHAVDFIEDLKHTVNARRKIMVESEELQRKRNEISREIGNQKNSLAPEKFEHLRQEVKAISHNIEQLKADLQQAEEKYNDYLLNLPNILLAEVPAGKDERDNQVVRQHGTIPVFAFTPLPHYEIMEKLQLADFDRGVKLAGSRFYVYNE